MFTMFNGLCIIVPSMAGLVVMRFIKGAFGSSLLANAGGVVADIFPASQRGLGIIVFSSAPLLGPVLGPVVGGFIAQNFGFRWLEGFLWGSANGRLNESNRLTSCIRTIFSGILWIVVALIVPETYSPVLLQRRAATLTNMTGRIYKSKAEEEINRSLRARLKIALTRPWTLLFLEPIVLLLSIYMAILYGTVRSLDTHFVYDWLTGE
jgi:MFS family permease